MAQQYFGFGYRTSSGLYLRQTREECIKIIQPKSEYEMRANVTGCILDKFTELDKALFASRQYILTLWPAFVGAIVALGPDPSSLVYDNIWWSTLFCLTCGGLPGLDTSSPTHHVEAHSDVEGRAMCENWQYKISQPKALSKTQTMGSATRGAGHVRFEWLAFFVGLALWAAFVVYFGHTLEHEATDFSFGSYWLKGAVWYYISASPAVLACVFELLQNRVDLYEPVNGEFGSVQEGSAKVQDHMIKTTSSKALTQQQYSRVEVRSVFSLWLRIFLHQWRRGKYRILIRDSTTHRFWWVFVLGRAAVGMGRVTVFALGSVTMGNILLMPPPHDLYLFVLLLFTTAIPRLLWPAFWANGNRGADLVIFVHSIKLIDSGPIE